MDKKETMTVQEAAALLGLHPQTLRRAIDRGAFPWATCIKAKRKIYVIYRHQFEQITGIKTKEE